MNKFYKKIVPIILITFSLPLVTILCCCMEEAQAAESSVHVHDGVKSHDHQGNHNHDDQSNPSHDHSQCDHEMSLSAFTNSNAVDFFNKSFEIFKYLT